MQFQSQNPLLYTLKQSITNGFRFQILIISRNSLIYQPMKNLTGKTFIFYTFQQKKELESNVIAYQPQKQPILIKDVIEQLPINLSKGRYHFRFKSEFFEGNQKIAGWIDINNLTAKVPLVGSSVYVKILKVKSNAHNKMFNLEKLARVGLGNSKPFESLKHVKGPQLGNAIPNQQKEQIKPISPISIPKPTQVKPLQNLRQKTSFEQINLMEGTVNISKSQPQRANSAPIHQPVKYPVAQVNPAAGKEDLFEFEQAKVFKNEQTTEEKVNFFKETMAAEEEEKINEGIARDELQEKIKKWGYSGAKTINNLTTLLSTLHQIWPEWPELSLTDLLNPEKLAAHTKKALIKTHPDKNRNKPFREKYLSKRVFELINEAKKAATSVS